MSDRNFRMGFARRAASPCRIGSASDEGRGEVIRRCSAQTLDRTRHEMTVSLALDDYKLEGDVDLTKSLDGGHGFRIDMRAKDLMCANTDE